MNKPRRRFKPIFISIRLKMLLGLGFTFGLIAVITAFLFFSIAMGFASHQLQKEALNMLTSVEKLIDTQELVALAQDGKSNAEGFSDDPRYIGLMDWLDMVHRVNPDAWPYVYVLGTQPGEVVYVADISARYAPGRAKKFLEPGVMSATNDEQLGDGVYLRELVGAMYSLKDAWGEWLTVYRPLVDANRKPIGGVAIDYATTPLKVIAKELLGVTAVSFGGALVVMLLLGLRIGSQFARPVVRLTRAAEKIGVGDTQAGLKLLNKPCRRVLFVDEIDSLGDTFCKLVNFQNALVSISTTANTSEDLEKLYALTCTEITGLVEAEKFSVVFYDSEKKRIQERSAQGSGQGACLQPPVEYPLGSPPNLTGYLIQNGETLSLTQADCNRLVKRGAVVNEAPLPSAWLGVPLKTAENQVFGALVMAGYAKRERYTENERELLSFIATQLAMVLRRRHMETELRQSYQFLEQRVEERTQDLQKANLQLQREVEERQRAEKEMQKAKEAAEAANRAKSSFLANMSHELRTPLNAILGFSRLLSHDPNLGLHHKEDLQIILQSGEHLLDLINDVLELSKIESGRMALTQSAFDLHALLMGLEEMFTVRAEDRQLSLIFEIAPDLPQYVRSDEKKLRQVLINLLSNAVKFTERGGVILRGGLKDSHLPGAVRLLFEVQDTGAGIPPEQVGDLFNYFVQADAGRKAQEGTGLGLSISRSFVQMMGGEISVSSQSGKGSLFAFEVDALLAGEDEIQPEAKQRRAVGLEPGQQTWRILVAEDREANRRLLLRLFQPFNAIQGVGGFEIREAANGREALDAWEAWSPHLIFMDMRMPVMDGHEATRQIRASLKGQATVIIALTASAFEEDRKLILSEGLNDFIRKPFQENEIFEVLSKHLGVIFLYESGVVQKMTQNKASRELKPAQLKGLPGAWLDDLTQASAAADGEKLQELVSQVRGSFSELAAVLDGLILEYRFDVISDAAQSAREEGK